MDESNGKVKYARMVIEKVVYNPLCDEYSVEAGGLDIKLSWKFKSEFPEVNVGDVLKVKVEYEASN